MNLNRITKNQFIYVIIYRLALDWHYFTLISTRHGVAYVDNRTIENLVVSWILLLSFYYVINRWGINQKEYLSSIVMLILFLISFVPFTTCIYAGMVSFDFLVYNAVYWLFLIGYLIISYNISIKQNIKFSIKAISKKHLLAFIGFITAALIVYVSWRYAHFRLITNLMDVYSFRKEASNYNYSPFLGYILSWTAAINPILMGVCFIRKKWLMTVACFAIQMLSFGIDGRKSTFFMPFIVMVFLLIYKRGDFIKLRELIIFGICLVTIGGIGEYTFLESSYVCDFGIRRVMIVPNQLGTCYYDFFTKNPPDYFRSSFLRHLGLKSPYVASDGRGVTYIIGDKYFGKPDMTCNNGLSSDAVANLGGVGCLIMPVLLVLTLRLLDRSSKNVDTRLLIVVGVYISYNLISTTLTTCLLTHGFIVLMMVLPLIGKERIYNTDWSRKNPKENLE